jgi:hypothetical protein
MITTKMRLNRYNLTQEQISILDSIEYDPADEMLLKVQIKKYLKKGYPISVLRDNWAEIVKLGRDSSSLKSHILRYGEKLGKDLFDQKTAATTITRQDYIRKYGKEAAIQHLSKRSSSLANFIERHGVEEGQRRWDEYLQKRAQAFAEGRKQNRYASRDLSWFQSKYGNKKGYEIWDKKRKDQAYKVSQQYYIDQYGLEEGVRRCRNSKTRSLRGFVNKYGYDEGRLRYNQWLKNVVAGLKNRRNYSIWATECCEEIKQHIADLHYYAENEMVWGLPKLYVNLLGQKMISPDLFYKGKIIEFHGDVFHGNPALFESHAKVHPFDRDITVEQLQEKDRIRKEYYQSKGYDVLEIWENDYKTDRLGVIEQCLIFLR